jgi:septum site-determining protein MinD
VGQTIGIMSLKGGVGKTTATASLGNAMADFGKKVLLVDGDLSAPNLGFHLNILNPEKTIHDVLNNLINIKDAIYKAGNLHMIPASLFNSENVNVLKLKDKLKNLKNNYDYILLDSAPTINEDALGVMLASDEILFVTTPDYSTLASTIKSINLAKKRGVPISGIILNRVYGKDFEIPLRDIERLSGVPVMAVIPHDLDIMKAQSEFIPSTSLKPNSLGSQEFKKLAATLVGERYKSYNLSNLFKQLTPTKQDINRELYYTSVF